MMIRFFAILLVALWFETGATVRAPVFEIHGDLASPPPSPPPPPPPPPQYSSSGAIGRSWPRNPFQRRYETPLRSKGLMFNPLVVLQFIPRALSRINQDEVVGVIQRVTFAAVNTAGACAIAFLGVQVASGIWKSLLDIRKRWHLRSKSDAFVRATFEDSEVSSELGNGLSLSQSKSSSVSKGSGSSSKGASLTLEELHAEQEEMWRVIHNIYKGQSDKLALLESAAAENKAQFESAVKETESALSMAMAKLTLRLDNMESSGRGAGAGASSIDSSEVDALRQELKVEAERQASAISALRQEVPTLLQQHDKAVIQKLQHFGDEVKKLIIQTGKGAKKSTGIAKNAAQTKSKAKPSPKPRDE